MEFNQYKIWKEKCVNLNYKLNSELIFTFKLFLPIIFFLCRKELMFKKKKLRVPFEKHSPLYKCLMDSFITSKIINL